MLCKSQGIASFEKIVHDNTANVTLGLNIGQSLKVILKTILCFIEHWIYQCGAILRKVGCCSLSYLLNMNCDEYNIFYRRINSM